MEAHHARAQDAWNIYCLEYSNDSWAVFQSMLGELEVISSDPRIHISSLAS